MAFVVFVTVSEDNILFRLCKYILLIEHTLGNKSFVNTKRACALGAHTVVALFLYFYEISVEHAKH